MARPYHPPTLLTRLGFKTQDDPDDPPLDQHLTWHGHGLTVKIPITQANPARIMAAILTARDRHHRQAARTALETLTGPLHLPPGNA